MREAAHPIGVNESKTIDSLTDAATRSNQCKMNSCYVKCSTLADGEGESAPAAAGQRCVRERERDSDDLLLNLVAISRPIRLDRGCRPGSRRVAQTDRGGVGRGAQARQLRGKDTRLSSMRRNILPRRNPFAYILSLCPRCFPASEEM